MHRLFVRVYLKLLGCVMLTALLVAVAILPGMRDKRIANIEADMAASVALVAEVLALEQARGEDVAGVVQRASARLRRDVTLIPYGDASLSEAMRARLDQGEVVPSGKRAGEGLLARIGGSDWVLSVGPPRIPFPLGDFRGFLVVALFALGLSVAAFVLVRPLERRLSSLSQVAQALGQGHFARRAADSGDDGIGALAGALNRMAAEIQRLLVAEQELLRMVSHELRTPIQRVHFALERLGDKRGGAAPEDAATIARIERDLEELDALIEELLAYVRLGDGVAPAPAPAEAGAVIEEVCEELVDFAREVALSPPPPEGGVVVEVEARWLRRAASNLVLNALGHARSRVEVRLTRDGDMVRLVVDDDGPGIPPAQRERIFEPFFRIEEEAAPRKPASPGRRRGFGLGLAIVRRIAEAHGGSVVALASPLGGARLRLSLPAARERAAASEPG